VPRIYPIYLIEGIYVIYIYHRIRKTVPYWNFILKNIYELFHMAKQES